jgi:isopentenyl-diphosphate Delta-isomerase
MGISVRNDADYTGALETSNVDDIPARKADHIDIAAGHPVSASISAGWDDVHLLHRALPEIDLDEVNLGTQLFGRELQAPVVIASMTGGHERAEVINRRLAVAANEFGLAIGVGSQRAAIRRPDLLATYRVARDTAPRALLIANIGAPQLIPQGATPALTVDQVRQLVADMRADALAVHLNYLQEVVQPGGDTHARGVLDAIGRLTAALDVPVIAKETGAGISRSQALALKQAGVAALDVGGAGGTSFALVESVRAEDQHLLAAARLGQLLGDWGLPTAVSVAQCAGLGLPVIATGGIRSGLDAAKAMAIGADLVGIARPMLSSALDGQEALHGYIEELLDSLRVVMFLTGARTLADLRDRERVVTGETALWLRSLKAGGGETRGP